MILTTSVTYRGKQKPVSELSQSSGYKVDVMCDICGKTRNVYYRSVLLAGHTMCLKCVNQQKRKHLNEGDIYGRLTVVLGSKKMGYSICKCTCGRIVEKNNTYLKKGYINSCGCLRKEAFKNTKKVRGSEHGMWKGGVTSQREAHMQRKEYKDWRRAVYERDNHTCQKCGQVGGRLNAHHIESYKENKEKRIDINNGITFCFECHIEYHRLYGKLNNDIKQTKTYTQ